MADILFVSKPVEPPWNDSSKNLVRDLASSLERHVPVVMGRRGADPSLPKGRAAGVYARGGASGFAPSLVDNARVLVRTLLAGEDLFHFFFAPNPRSGAAARLAVRARRKPSVHTICSVPREGLDLSSILFADVNVVLSHHTFRHFVEAGIPEERLRRIAPSIPPLDVPTEGARREARAAFGLPVDAPVVCYPGDLEFGRGARTIVEAVAALRRTDVFLVLACRAKTHEAKAREQELRALVASSGIEARTCFVGETRRIHDLLATSDVVALPSDTLYAKMDYPLVLLEAMCLERPVIVGRGTPAEELCEGDAARAVAVDVDAVAAELDRLLGDDGARKALGSLAREAVLSRHVPARMSARYEALYDALLG